MFEVWYNFIIGNRSGKYEVFNYTLEPTAHRTFELACEVIVPKDSKSRKEGIALSKELLGNGEVLVGHVNCKHTQEEMFEELTRLNTEKNLCPTWYGDRGASTSGFSTPHTMKILEESEIFGSLVQRIVRTRNGNPKSIWVSANVKGSHRPHQDGFRSGVNRRNLFTIGGENKVMWFRCKETGSHFGLRIPHGCLITIAPSNIISLVERTRGYLHLRPHK